MLAGIPQPQGWTAVMGRVGADAFGAVLRRYRMAAGLSQEQLAEQAGLSAHGISDLERGARTHPYPETVQRLAQALGLSDPEHAELRRAASNRAAVI